VRDKQSSQLGRLQNGLWLDNPLYLNFKSPRFTGKMYNDAKDEREHEMAFLKYSFIGTIIYIFLL
jgi:hypothetical protein